MIYLCVIIIQNGTREFPGSNPLSQQRHNSYHIKVDWETHQILLKYRDKLTCSMAGRNSQEDARDSGTADYKEEERSNPVIRSFIASFGVASIRSRLSSRLPASVFVCSIHMPDQSAPCFCQNAARNIMASQYKPKSE